MSQEKDKNKEPKISPQLAGRLNKLAAGGKIRVFLLLGRDETTRDGAARQGPEQRRAAVEEMRRSAAAVLEEIDAVLEKHAGERLQDQPTALGSILVESPPAGVLALAQLPQVSTILEDQPITSLI